MPLLDILQDINYIIEQLTFVKRRHPKITNKRDHNQSERSLSTFAIRIALLFQESNWFEIEKSLR